MRKRYNHLYPDEAKAFNKLIIEILKKYFGGKAWFKGGSYAYLMDVQNPKKMFASDGSEVKINNFVQGITGWADEYVRDDFFNELDDGDDITYWTKEAALDYFRPIKPGENREQARHELDMMGMSEQTQTMEKSMTVLKDLLSISAKQIQETEVNKAGVEISLARKYMDQALKKGYPKDAAINYTAKLVKSQGFTADYSKQCAEQAYKDLAEETVTEEMDPNKLADQLEELMEGMSDYVFQMKKLLRQASPQIRRHAESYWLPALVTALGSDHDYMGGTSKYDTMAATIKKLREEGEGAPE
jgi:hypothetical protein